VAPNAEAYLRRVDRELRSLELRLQQLIRGTALQALAQLRDLLSSLPSDGLSRRLAYRQLRPHLETALIPLNDTLASLLSLELHRFTTRARELAAQFAGITPADPVPLPAEVMARTRFLGRTLAAYFERHSPSQFMREILRLADRTVEKAILDGTPTPDLLPLVLPEATRKGRRIPIVRRGSIAYTALARINALITTSIWNVYSAESRQIWNRLPNLVAWEWVAILDPKTCPICRPLDGRREQSLESFEVLPQVHPHCRCVVIPIRE
jgi:SPP1 gp7 family putative phage head morphogenesis protein